MQKLTLKEIQQEEFKLLSKALAVFEKNQIQYELCWGTLLGAIRHDGFIPWDDDIDIFVPRKDYEKIKKLVKAGRFELSGAECQIPGQKKALYPFIKIYDQTTIVNDNYTAEKYPLHLWIDVFPLDHVPDNHLGQKVVLFLNLFFRAAHSMEITRDGIKRNRLMRGFFRGLYYVLGGYRNINRIIDFNARIVNFLFSKSHSLANGTWPDGIKDYFDEDLLWPVSQHSFEGSMLTIPKNYDKNLEHCYGDYMKLPPEDQRYGHSIEAWR